MALKLDHLKLNDCTLSELKELRQEIDGLLSKKAADEREKLQKQMDEIDALLGSPVAAKGPVRQRAAPKAKYRSKANPELSWAGRGAQPRWLTAEIAETGKKLEDFAV